MAAFHLHFTFPVPVFFRGPLSPYARRKFEPLRSLSAYALLPAILEISEGPFLDFLYLTIWITDSISFSPTEPT